MYVSLRVGMTGFQRWVVGAAAALVAVRLFHPVTYVSIRGVNYSDSYWPWDSHRFAGLAQMSDMPTTVLHVLGILVLAAVVAVCEKPVQDWFTRGLVDALRFVILGSSNGNSGTQGGVPDIPPDSASVSASEPTQPVATLGGGTPAVTPTKQARAENAVSGPVQEERVSQHGASGRGQSEEVSAQEWSRLVPESRPDATPPPDEPRRNGYLIPWTIAALLALALLIGRSAEGFAYTVGDLIGRAALLFVETRLARLGLERLHAGPRAVAWLTALGVILANMVIAVALGQDERAVRRDSVYYLPGLLVWVGWDNKRSIRKASASTQATG